MLSGKSYPGIFSVLCSLEVSEPSRPLGISLWGIETLSKTKNSKYSIPIIRVAQSFVKITHFENCY